MYGTLNVRWKNIFSFCIVYLSGFFFKVRNLSKLFYFWSARFCKNPKFRQYWRNCDVISLLAKRKLNKLGVNCELSKYLLDSFIKVVKKFLRDTKNRVKYILFLNLSHYSFMFISGFPFGAKLFWCGNWTEASDRDYKWSGWDNCRETIQGWEDQR